METVSLWENIHLDYLEKQYSPRAFSEYVTAVQNILRDINDDDKIPLLMSLINTHLSNAYDLGYKDGVRDGHCEADQDAYAGGFKEGYEKGQEDTLTMYLKEENEN